MSSRAGRAPRVIRGVAAAAAATFFATVSHGAVDAALPAAVNIVVALCLATPACVLLAGRSLSWGRLAAAVVVSQALFHGILALDLTGAGAGVAFATGAHHDTAALAGQTAVATAEHTSHSPGMWAAHALAAVVTVLALGRGERAAQVIVRFVIAVLRVLRPFRGIAAPTDAILDAPEPLLLPRAMTVLSPMRHRGPPRAA